jgi:nucleoid-associated protein YgaU
MAAPLPPSTMWLRLALLGGAVVVVLAAAAMWMRAAPPSPPPRMAALSTQPAPPPNATPPTKPRGPDFDAVVVAPDGGSVLAGHATPGASVVVHDGDKIVGTAQADSNGNWLITPGDHLPPGPHALTLSENLPGGGAQQGDTPALVDVPHPTDSGPAITALAPPGSAPVVLHGQGSPPPSTPTLEAVAYGDQGAVTFTGRAAPNAKLQIYVDNRPVGSVITGADGAWSYTPGTAIPAGKHDLRLDQLAPDGKVTARSAQPFAREVASTPVQPGTPFTIQPGYTLWRLAREAYGAGPRYVAIFHANQVLIHDPNRIYPGQILAVPGSQPSSPASSSPASSRPDSASTSK